MGTSNYLLQLEAGMKKLKELEQLVWEARRELEDDTFKALSLRLGFAVQAFKRLRQDMQSDLGVEQAVGMCPFPKCDCDVRVRKDGKCQEGKLIAED